ncbi:MAG: hypothetical protein ACTSYL_10835 [Candidatus Thorarchaeota archaeon]
MTYRIQYVSFLPIPELVLKRDHLREPLRFLGWRDRLWKTFTTSLEKRSNLRTNIFVHGIGELRWHLKDHMLIMAVHQNRLASDYGMHHRMPIPLVARKSQQVVISKREYHRVDEVRVYPSLFAQAVTKITSSVDKPIPPPVATKIASEFNDALGEIKQRLSKSLFRERGAIAPNFSNFFTLKTSTRPSDNKRSYSVEYHPEKNTISMTTATGSRILLRRLSEAVSLSLAQRTVIPILWNALMRTTFKRTPIIKELTESLLIAHAPTYYIYSDKLSPHILPWGYQRRAFETIAKKLELEKMEQKIKREFLDWLASIPPRDTVLLVDCSEPLGSQIGRALLRIAAKATDLDMQPPLKTLFDYLVLAYLHDKQLMDTDPSFHKIPDDRLGLRTTNKIDEGMTRLERTKRYAPRHKKTDLYEVPGPLVQQLKVLGVITSQSVQMTSASMGFRIVDDNSHVVRRCIELAKSMSPNDRAELGV